ncbi:IS3 family transposase [bacterium]|nr:IS3 family transposase [bacterium]
MFESGERIHKKIECLNCSGRTKEKQKAEIVTQLRQKYPLEILLIISKVKRSTYYYHEKKGKVDKYAVEKEEIIELFNYHKQRYGYRRITDEMKAKGYIINHKTVLKLMKSLNLKGKQRKNEKYHSYKGEVGKVAENLLRRDFSAEKPFEKLTTDVTQFNVCGEKVYLSPILDLYNREIVSYSISLSPNLEQIREMLSGLFEKLPETARPLFHSDQGWQYQHAEYQRLLKEHNITQSMSRKGNCMDNGAMENFFGRLKVEMFYGEKFESVNAFIEKLKEYIEYYNNERIITKLKTSPVKYRTCHQ